MVVAIRIYIDRTVRSMLIVRSDDARAARVRLRVRRDIEMGRPLMAAARDQAARIIRSEPEAAEGEAARDAAALPDSCGLMLRKKPGAGPPERQPRRRRTPRRRRPPPSCRAEIRQAQIRHDGRPRVARARRRQLRRLLCPGRALLRFDRRRLCARQQHHAGRPRVGPYRGDPARRQFDRARRRRDLQDRRRRLSHRGRCRAHQDRDPAGHHRPHRPPGHRAWKARSSRPRRSSSPRKPR